MRWNNLDKNGHVTTQTMQTVDCRMRIFFENVWFFFCFFDLIIIFLACDILEKKKRKEKLELVYKGDGLVKNVLLQLSVFLV